MKVPLLDKVPESYRYIAKQVLPAGVVLALSFANTIFNTHTPPVGMGITDQVRHIVGLKTDCLTGRNTQEGSTMYANIPALYPIADTQNNSHALVIRTLKNRVDMDGLSEEICALQQHPHFANLHRPQLLIDASINNSTVTFYPTYHQRAEIAKTFPSLIVNNGTERLFDLEGSSDIKRFISDILLLLTLLLIGIAFGKVMSDKFYDQYIGELEHELDTANKKICHLRSSYYEQNEQLLKLVEQLEQEINVLRSSHSQENAQLFKLVNRAELLLLRFYTEVQRRIS